MAIQRSKGKVRETEVGELSLILAVRERNLVKLRAKNYEGSDEDWTAVLRHTLVTKQAGVHNLEVSCSISGKDPKATLAVSFRSRVEEITQRLGSIELPQTQDTDDVDLFGWATQAIARRDELEVILRQERAKAGTAEDIITSLQAQLADLIKAKDEHEEEMMGKFVVLLNEKKTLLRERQRQLATGKMDEKKIKDLEKQLGPKAKTTRGRKRAVEQVGESESEGFDDMMGIGKDDAKRRERSQSTMTVETESDDDLDQPVTFQTEGREVPCKPAVKSPASMPPRRDLPFAKNNPQNDPTPERQTADDEETASEDDEL
jgi:DNA double-strand break repair and V(D)J recombination protein XRCC4